MKLWFIAIVLLSGMAQAADSVDATLDHLAKIEYFAFGGVGYAGVTSPGEKDYRIILARQSALADFEKLYSVGNIQAKCYALVGMRTLNPKRFEELVSTLRSSKEKVETMAGCIQSSEPLRDVLKRIEADEYGKKNVSLSQH